MIGKCGVPDNDMLRFKNFCPEPPCAIESLGSLTRPAEKWPHQILNKIKSTGEIV